MILPRRSFLTGLAAAMAAPAIVRVESLMKLPAPAKTVFRVIQLGDKVTFGDITIGMVTSVHYSILGDSRVAITGRLVHGELKSREVPITAAEIADILAATGLG